MQPLRSLLIYLLGVFLAGALLAPWVQAGILWGSAHWTGLQGLAAHAFHRYVTRTIEILALLGLWPLLRRLGVRSWADVGLCRPAGVWRRWVAGFGLGFASLAVAAAIGWGAGARTWRSDLAGSVLAGHAANALASAVVVALLEELLFRGALFGGLRRAHPWPVALGVSSAIYALVHFFESPPTPAHLHWYSGLVVLAQMLGGFLELTTLVPAFFSLFVVGAILCLAYERTGHLYFSMGLHAGWVFWLKFYRATMIESGQNPLPWLLGSRQLVDGWLTLLLLFAVWAWVWLRLKPARSHGRTD